MKFNEAKKIIEDTLAKEAEMLSLQDISAEYEITYQTEMGEVCEYDDKKMRFVTGSLYLKHSELSDDERLEFSVVFYCKRGNIKDGEAEGELEGFKNELASFKEELEKSQYPAEFMRALIIATNEQNEQITKEFQAQIAKIDKNLKIMTYSVIAIAVVGLIAVILRALL